MFRGAIIALAAAVLVGVGLQWDGRTAVAQSSGGNLQITVTNLTPGQPLTPAVVIVHDANAVILPSSAERLAGLEELAESGANAALIETLSDRDGVSSVARFGGIIPPNSGASIQNVAASAGDHITVIGMLACTNDAIAIGTVVISESGELPVIGSGRVLDAGTEDNSEDEADVPCLGGEGVSDAETADGEGQISNHVGIAGTGSLSAETHGWVGAAIQITVNERGSPILDSAMTNINIQNMTFGQPLTAPLIIVHDQSIHPLDYQRPTELPGIGDFSEGGLAATLIPTLLAIPGVVDVAQVPGPGEGGVILPGGGITIPAVVLDGAYITVAGMFACTNDAFVVAEVPVSIVDGTVELMRDVGVVYDSGTEANDETTATVPCLGRAAAALSEGHAEGSRAEHPGVTGDGDLIPLAHSWHPDGTMALSIGGPALAPTPLPSVGGYSPSNSWVLFAGIAGLALLVLGTPMIFRAVSRRD